ncbi:unnamed protein product [Rotaria socialis]|uniref:SCP domain-containing protein n=1 Tax=Rotaria socialis TaxID=392032 RepID=A0A817K6C6_9BILA|nr:unnamed protein product [Rotaria socialis]CAF3760526.1 unnamed protein product [Rotaria socialis]CAF4466768.1 unnamed protein product [Rotaria socialis]CAF4774376.1 unnamed protein product [Rotaria socialis]
MRWYLITLFALFDSLLLQTGLAYNIGSRSKRDGTDSSGENLKTFQQQALVSHNSYRAKHCAPALVLDDGISQSAQTYAEKLATIGHLVHSNSAGLGENLYSMSSSEALKTLSGSQPVTAWYNEVQDYNFGSPGFSSETGHFTQVVWKGTTKFGIGLAFSSDQRTAYVVAQYSPPGNYLNQFARNIASTGC